MRKGIHFLFGQKEPVTDFYQVIDRFASLGFDGVELPPDPFLVKDGGLARDLKAYAEEKRVEVVLGCGFPGDCDMASDDRTAREKGIELMRRILQVMERLDIRLLGGTGYTRWPSGRTKPLLMEEKQRLLVRTAGCLKEAVKEIEGSSIVLAIEPLNRFEGFLVNTAKEGAAFCRLVDSPNVGLMLDGFHMAVEEDSIPEAVRTAGGLLKHLHLAENNRKLPGLGAFPWDAYFGALREIGYQGRFHIESFMTPGGSVSASVALWRDLEEGADPAQENRLLADALSFLEEKGRQYGF